MPDRSRTAPAQWRILVVDDEPAVLALMEKLLSTESYLVETAADAPSAWEKLNRQGNCFDFVILDRIMPGICGLELLKRIKADECLRRIPIIMLSGAAAPDEIAEGIEAGAFYYLTKPFASKALLAIARAVTADIRLHAEAAAQTADLVESLKYLTRAELRFSTIDDIKRVTGMLAALCPDPESAAIGFYELLLNALEHGNLAITYEEKKRLMLEDQWEAELERRLALPAFANRRVTVSFEQRERALEFRITDQGTGFEWTRFLELDPRRSLDPNGRGIAMARRISFSTLEYQGSGNSVIATIET